MSLLQPSINQPFMVFILSKAPCYRAGLLGGCFLVVSPGSYDMSGPMGLLLILGHSAVVTYVPVLSLRDKQSAASQQGRRENG